jgi:hypothetical protein
VRKKEPWFYLRKKDQGCGERSGVEEREKIVRRGGTREWGRRLWTVDLSVRVGQ